jgi:hypothetical protein
MNGPDAQVVNPQKLIRIAGSVAEVLDTVDHGAMDEDALVRLVELCRRAVIGVGSALDDPLLEEFTALMPAAQEIETLGEVRVIEALLRGWVAGVMTTATIDLADA